MKKWMNEMKFEGNGLRSLASVEQTVDPAVFFLTRGEGFGPMPFHLDVLLGQASPESAQQVSSGAGPGVPGAPCQGVQGREPQMSGCPLGQRHPFHLFFDFILDCQRICSHWLYRRPGPTHHWPEE